MNTPLLEAVVDVRDLRLEIKGRRILDVPSLTVRHGERVALIGPNGAGKSSLLKVLGGFASASQGHVVVLGREVTGAGPNAMDAAQWRALRAEIGQVMQGLHLVARLSALENVVLGALARPGAMPLWRSWLRCYPESLLREARQALADLGLEDRIDTRADHLSGGERQKVSLARLRLQRPKLLLADEPTSALDPAAALQACDALAAFAADATLLTVVHDTELLPHLADRVIGLREGRLVFDVPLQALSPDLLKNLYETGDPADGYHRDPRTNLPLALPLRPRGFPASAGRCTA
ncbi:MAG: ATP-binding cassette domain-containing protein [Comamonadaceae bacterium]|nr:ATP-binding cassette domain-containing protein [Comamonadaceae bacterium]